jgi:hypothetical protein
MTISKAQVTAAEHLAFDRGYQAGSTQAKEALKKDAEYLKRSGVFALIEAVAKVAESNAEVTTAMAHLVDNLNFHL